MFIFNSAKAYARALRTKAVPPCAATLIAVSGTVLTGTWTAMLALAFLLSSGPAQAARPGDCGRENQRACNMWEFLPSCAAGLFEWPLGKCIKAPTPSDVGKTIRSDAALTGAELNGAANTAGKTFSRAASDTKSAYEKTKSDLESSFKSTSAQWSAGARQAVQQFNDSLGRLDHTLKNLDASTLAALNRIVRAIPTGSLDEQARNDMQLLAGKLGMLTDQADALFPNIKDSIFGIFLQRSVALGIGVSESYAIVMGTREVNGVLPVGVVYTIGGSAGPDNVGYSNQIGIMWQPGSIDNAGGGNVGLGVDIPNASIGVSWNVAAGMEKEGPKGAIPGFALGFTKSCCSDSAKYSTTLTGGYAKLINKWAGDPIVADWGYVYGVQANGDLWYWRLDASGKFGASGKIGQGWSGMRVVTAGDNGELFAVGANGDLYWYKHDSNMSWRVSGAKIGIGWDAMKAVFSGGTVNGSRIVYAVDAGGTLKRYIFNPAPNGSIANTNTTDIGWGWNFSRVFAGPNGVVYAIASDGRLMRYAYGSTSGAPKPQWVGTGWGGFKHVFAGPNGAIYAIDSKDYFLYYRDLGDGRVIGPQSIGYGFGQPILTGMLKW